MYATILNKQSLDLDKDNKLILRRIAKYMTLTPREGKEKDLHLHLPNCTCTTKTRLLAVYNYVTECNKANIFNIK